MGAVLTRALLFALFLLATGLGCAAEESFTGRVATIDDGDSFVVHSSGGRKVRVRLAGIDAPEWSQPGGLRARQALTRLVRGVVVTVIPLGTDRYGRTIARVYAGENNVIHELVRTGHAWIYHRYNEDSVLSAFEQEARQAKRGIWALPEAERVPPWIWRLQHQR